jgi:hypothetical protein
MIPIQTRIPNANLDPANQNQGRSESATLLKRIRSLSFRM